MNVVKVMAVSWFLIRQVLPGNGLWVRELLGRLAGQVVSSCYDGLVEMQLK